MESIRGINSCCYPSFMWNYD